MNRLLLSILFLLHLLFYSCSNEVKSDVPKYITKQFNGDTINLQEIAKNKVIFIFVWTTYCDNCLTEISNIHNIYTKYKSNKNFSFVTIALNSNEELNQFTSVRDTTNKYQLYLRYLKLNEFDMPILVSMKKGYDFYDRDDGSYFPALTDTSELSKVYQIFSFRGIPTTMIYSAQGKLVYKYTGVHSKVSDLEKYKLFLDKTIDSLVTQ
jgi:thiol-disulfide isomerase/thioredoxin